MDNISNKTSIYTENRIHLADGVMVLRDQDKIDIVVINMEQNRMVKELFATNNYAKVIIHFYNPVHGVYENSAILDRIVGNRFSFKSVELLGNVQRREFVKVKLRHYVDIKSYRQRKHIKPKTKKPIYDYRMTRIRKGIRKLKYKIVKFGRMGDFRVVYDRIQVCILDISAGGILITTSHEFNVGDSFKFRFEKSRVPINLTAIVLRKEIVRLREFKYGCKFTGITDHDTALLCEYIYKRQMELYKTNNEYNE